MNSRTTEVNRRVWRLLLAVADANDPAQRMLAREVGEDPKAWHQIALATALMAVQLLDEFMAAETEKEANALMAADLADPDITARAREYTISRIERRLVHALDTDPDE